MRLDHGGDGDRTVTACLLELLLRSDGGRTLWILLDLASVFHFLKEQASNHSSLSLKGSVTFALAGQGVEGFGVAMAHTLSHP